MRLIYLISYFFSIFSHCHILAGFPLSAAAFFSPSQPPAENSTLPVPPVAGLLHLLLWTTSALLCGGNGGRQDTRHSSRCTPGHNFIALVPAPPRAPVPPSTLQNPEGEPPTRSDLTRRTVSRRPSQSGGEVSTEDFSVLPPCPSAPPASDPGNPRGSSYSECSLPSLALPALQGSPRIPVFLHVVDPPHSIVYQLQDPGGQWEVLSLPNQEQDRPPVPEQRVLTSLASLPSSSSISSRFSAWFPLARPRPPLPQTGSV